MTNMAVDSINRENELTLWLLISSPRPVTTSWILDYYDIDLNALHQDLSVIGDFTKTFRLTLNPEFDQLSIFGHENDIQQGIMFILMDLYSQTNGQQDHLPQTPFVKQRVIAKIHDGVKNLAAFSDLNESSQVDITNYLWTLTMRYHYGTVKHAAFQQLFTDKQANMIQEYDKLFNWSKGILHDLAQLYKDFEFPELEVYLLTLRVWLNK